MNEAELQERLNEFELQLLKGADNSVVRLALRAYLCGLAGTSQSFSTSEIIEILASQTAPQSGGAATVLRALAHSDLLQDNAANKLNRGVVQLCERALPNFCSFVGVKAKNQTFEKFEVLRTAFKWVETQLLPLKAPYSTLDSILGTKGPILASVSHGRLIEYAAVYRLPEVRDALESVLARLGQVARIESTLSADVESCERAIREAENLINDYPSFLTVLYLKPFLISAETCLDTFLVTLRGRFTAKIEQGWSGIELPKRYPMHEANRDLRVSLPLNNPGPGAAVDVRVTLTTSSDHVIFVNDQISVGNVSAGQFSVALDIHVVDPCERFDTLVSVDWGEIGSVERQDAMFDVRVRAQSAEIDWESQIYADPYGTGPAQGESFVGRREQIQALVSRMLRTPMEPSYITGQKRVGKTSLATAAAKQAQIRDPKSKLTWIDILWGQISHEDPRVSMRNLGQEIEQCILGQFPSNVQLPIGNYDGSLSALIKLSSAVRLVDPERRFVIIIDEFDEMPQELYLHGNLAETFFGNIRAITATTNICLLLVGGENMPFVMDRQGQKLNKFAKVDLSYFSRVTEWDDYTQLVREPAKGTLEWHSDTVAEVYDLTNGNPYFSKIICSKIFARALRERDADVTRAEVREVLDEEISRLDDNLFAHLWQDGIFAPIGEREPVVLKRKRVLAALARCIRDQLPTTLTNVHSKRGTSELLEGELSSVCNDFVSRGVLTDRGGEYEFVLPIFKLWLVDVGLTRLASETLSRELASEAQRAEDEARVLSKELVDVTSTWPTYRGRHVGPEDVRAWLDQHSGNREQRLLFTMLQKLRFVSEAEVLERIRATRLVVLGLVDVAVRRDSTERRNDIVITYVDGEGKSGQRHAALYAEENLVAATSILPPSSFRSAFESHLERYGRPKVLVIIDDFVGTGASLSANTRRFLEESADFLKDDQTSILVYALFATADGQQVVLNSLRDLGYPKLDFRAGEILQDSAFAFNGQCGIFATPEDRDRAKAMATDIGARIYKRAPLGFGGQGLLLVFPTTVPNNSLPLLHSHGRGAAPQWRPLFPRLVN